MTNESILEALKVQPLTEEEKEKRHILKRLTGPIASCKEGTRNGRKYNKELWEQAFNDEIFREKIANKGLFLELGHPTDREEIDMEKACACIPEIPKIIDGDLYAVVDVLDTPVGKILNTLIDYGFKPGISSRGTGDVVGDEVDPETFCLETWDIVNVPALEKARLSVTESLDKNQNSMLNLKKALCESLQGETEEHKKVMKETLNGLGINLDESVESNSEKSEDKITESETEKQTSDETKEANNDGSEELIKSLTESIKEVAELKAEVKSLQEKLAVSDAKVSNLEEELNRGKTTIVRLTTLARDSKAKSEKISSLEEELKEKTKVIEQLNESLTVQKESKVDNSLNEELTSKSGEVTRLTEELTSIKESYTKEITELKENLEKVKSDSVNKTNELNAKVKKAQKFAEGWKRMTYDVYEDYIQSKATMLDIKKEQIKNRLPESYVLADINKVCDDLMEEMNTKTLPFRVGKGAVVKVTESKNPNIKSPVVSVDDDDYVDEDSFRIAGFNK